MIRFTGRKGMKDFRISKRYWKDPATPMGTLDESLKRDPEVINLSLGDTDLITPELIINKALEDARAGHTKYTDFRGDLELRKEIADYYQETFDLDVKDEEIFVSTSGSLAMYLVLESILDEEDEVILLSPYFTPYPNQVKLAGGIPIECELLEEEGYHIDLGRLERSINVRTKAIIINTPNNPTGQCLSRNDLESIFALAQKYDFLVVADDIYTAYSYQDPFLPMMMIDPMKERTITINSFSKDYLMTGWRVGNVIAHPHIIQTIQAVNERVAFTAPSISQRAAIHAIRHRKEIQDDYINEYRKRVFYAAERVGRISWMSVPEPKGTFYLFVNVKKSGLTSVEVSNMLLEKAKVMTIPGNAFGRAGEGYIRIACTVPVNILKEAFDRIERIGIDMKNMGGLSC